MSYVTVIKSIKPETLGKLYKLTDAGVLTKNAVANVWLGKATSVRVDAPEGLAKVLKHACQRGDLALMSGRLSGAGTKQVVNLVTEQRLGEMLGCKRGDTLGGVQEIDGKKYALSSDLQVRGLSRRERNLEGHLTHGYSSPNPRKSKCSENM